MIKSILGLFRKDGASSAIGIVDRLTSSDNTLERGQQLQLMKNGAKARLMIVKWVVPYVLFIITIVLAGEFFERTLSDNFYAVLEKLLYAFGLIMGFYFYYGTQSAKVADRLAEGITPVGNNPVGNNHVSVGTTMVVPYRNKSVIKRNRQDDLTYRNAFRDEK